eukprot:symbB.v1.2.012645.t1/scaffold877.1/size158077/2
MQRASCASAYLVQNAGVPLQLLEARCTPELKNLKVELPQLDKGDLELQFLEVGRQLARLLDKSFSGWPQFLDAYVSREGRAAVNRRIEESLSQSLICPASNFSSGELREIDVPAGWTSVALLCTTLIFLMVYLCWLLQLRKSLPRPPAGEPLDHGFLPPEVSRDARPANMLTLPVSDGPPALLATESSTSSDGMPSSRPTSIRSWPIPSLNLEDAKADEFLRALDFMHKVETFDPLPHEEFADLARRFVPRRVSDGQAILRQGFEGTELYFIQMGTVSIRRRLGDVEQELFRLRQGAYFGETALIEHEPQQDSAYAVGEVMLWGLSKNDFYDCRLPERLKFEVHHPQSRNALQILFGRTSRRIRSFYRVCFTLMVYLLVSGCIFHTLEGEGTT